MSHVQTVLGPVSAEELGGVLPHEHLLSLVPGPWLSGGRSGGRPDAIRIAVDALAPLKDAGVDTIVDLSPYGVVGRSATGSNVLALRELSERTGLHVVAGSSVYLEAMSPAWVRDLDADGLAERFISDATTGFGDTGVRAGIFGEQATGLGVVTDFEEKNLRAAARAARATGLAIATHTTHGTMVREQIAILTDENTDLSRVVIGHLDIPESPDDVLYALNAGANVAIDTIGKQHWDFFLGAEPVRADGEYTKRAYFRSDVSRAARVADLVAAGWADRLFLAMDLTGAEAYLNPLTHGQWGYSYLSAVFLPLLRDHGVTETDIATMTHVNPRRLLTVGGTR
ncbi:hypothetical protein VD659_12080 [Herbiconiux sp. 11R-BC]|uniref:phosphotriesterase family protein n=1 Tax=Herbiconiux sp. 11R-BC TaxID=3111637 RepID=UPI003C04C5E1